MGWEPLKTAQEHWILDIVTLGGRAISGVKVLNFGACDTSWLEGKVKACSRCTSK